ncbi:A/G-specific adenine glycosylase [Sphingomonas sp. G-3-2-10]|uniref:A/G-specific adenine glycosylase n=1 Tax=Sphingomonas sp. G-3-2-10 TaxID=2728838 RepID=UPI00146B1FBD|nr:A/G-specific adenine glycosylase [Sphingomonas sp. G-3-2-10]NML07703.1 A/G-specific adenine glycosylase [Sphingomonas sp. G-3-2-10]
MLPWYDANARDLPWRARPGANATEPYRVWLSEVMLQQTQVATVKPYFEKFTSRWPSFEALAAEEDAEVMSAWAGLGYYARARNMLACARAVAAGGMPDTEEGLLRLPGVGGYTAAAVAAIAFGRRAVVVDGNVERVVSRLFAVREALPGAKGRIRDLTDSITPDTRAGDFAQAMMDLGATVCTARGPRCLLCPLRADCAGFATGEPETFPVKTKKPERPQRYGTMFWAERDGQVLLVRRPDKGLLGGMRALPTGPWRESPPGLEDAPVAGDWRLLGDTVSHGFTHFRLDCALAVATIGAQEIAHGEWWPVAEIESAGLPTVFAKAARAIRRDT